MIPLKRALLALSFFILVFTSFSQSAKPKIGLVLSGGGAKGIAHIRILQVLDSLGIVPDYIAGTSMGSVVGALYASGYSGNQIDSIAKVISWTSLFTNAITFPEINIEEKDEFGRYVYDLPLLGMKPQFPMGVVEGQQIEELLSNLFFPVKTITDFNKLPTPFLCVAADIVQGEPVILRSGSLASAVRASMSIPTVFSPVRINNRLLVDGGVYMNLPVTYCRQMGADYIIAVDVGGGLMKEEELTSAVSLLLQTTFLAGNISYEREKEKSDIFVDVVKHLKYGTMDFEYGDSMMVSGDLAVKEVMPQLVELANNMKQFSKRKIQRIPKRPGHYTLDQIDLSGISEDNKKLVLTKFEWKPGDKISREQAGASVHRLLGTRLFDKITYRIEGDSVKSVMTIDGKEKPSNAVKFAIHYDTDRGAGLILNYTKRNVLLPASRMVITLDLAENPRFRFNYYYYLGKQMKWWNFNEVYSERVLLNSFINGTPISDLFNQHVVIRSMFNRTVSRYSYWGLGMGWQRNQLKPKIDPRDETNPDFIEVINYKMNLLSANIHYVHNTLDKVYFPSKGTLVKMEGRLNFDNPFSVDFLFSTDSVQTSTNLSGLIQPYARLNIQVLKNISITSKSTLQLIGQIGLTQEVSDISNRLSAYSVGAGDFIFVGGLVPRSRANYFLFTGLREGEVAAPQVMTVGAQLQYSPVKNFYLSPAVNLLAAGYDPSDYWSTLFDFNFNEQNDTGAFYQFGYGITASYMSLIGPIQVSVSRDEQIDEFRFFFNLGFNF